MTTSHLKQLSVDALTGAISGVFSAWIMSRFQTRVVPKIKEGLSTGPSKKENQREKSKGDPATVVAAEKASELIFRRQLRNENKPVAGSLVHYLFGGSLGALYAVLGDYVPRTRIAAGLPYGLTVFLLADEGLVPTLGLTKKPTAYPFSTHVYALASHLVYGLTLNQTERFLHRLRLHGGLSGSADSLPHA